MEIRKTTIVEAVTTDGRPMEEGKKYVTGSGVRSAPIFAGGNTLP